jgi:[NiFe] hydrogenase diaphorase moiety large subunit
MATQLKRTELIFKEDVDYSALMHKIMKMGKDKFISDLMDSGLKGRGGAGFPTGLKWKIVKEDATPVKYIVCNADEGEPGTFKDKEILEKACEKVIWGMTLAAYITGAKEGYIYIRAEYKYLKTKLQIAIDRMESNIKTLGINFKLGLAWGAGAYICGEETALLQSMEGRRGEPTNKPPYPVNSGYLGKPTVVNNVETFVNAMIIAEIGAEEYKKLGTKASQGSKLFSVSGDCSKEGVFELEMGMTVQQFVDEFGDGDTKAVQVGGASGFCVPRKEFKNTIIGFEGVPTGGSMKVFNSSRSMYNILENYLTFFEEESCGQCTPCRVGTQQLLHGIRAVKRKEKPKTYLDELLRLAYTMKYASKCGLGRSVGNAFRSIIENFREEIVY